MGDLALIVLNAGSKDGATAALALAKKLDHEGWIELIDYSLASKDENGHVTAHELDDERAEKIAAVVAGAAVGVASGSLGGPAAAVVGAAGALAGVGSMKLIERIVLDAPPQGFPQSLEPNSSALAIIVEDRYAERVEEELGKLGVIARRELKRSERDAEFDAYLQRCKGKIHSIQHDIQAQTAKTRTATTAEKIKLEADIAAKREELEARREKLEDHIKAMNSDLRGEIREMNFRLELAGLAAKDATAAAIDRLHRQLNSFNDEFENLVEGQIESLTEHTSELKAKATKATGETKAAIEQHLASVQARIRKERRALVNSFEERFLEAKQWFTDLQVRATLGRADLRDKLQASIKKAQQSLAELKAQVRVEHGENERAWKDIRQGFDKACKDLADAFDQANREHD